MQANTDRASNTPDSSADSIACAPRVTVIGIGNSLMTDDGAGVHVAEALRGRGLGDHVRVLDGGTLSFTLLDEVEEAEFLVVADAAQLDAEPGTVRLFRDREMDVYLSAANRPSVHEVNLMDVLTAARIRGRMPNRYALVGIQPESIGWGTAPSATVAAAVDQAVMLIERMVMELNETPAAAEAEELTA